MQDELFTWYQMNTEQEKEEFLADLIAADSEEEEDMIIAEMEERGFSDLDITDLLLQADKYR